MAIRAETGMIFESGKTYTHSVGLSCCFRQWRAQSHCRFLHGYALQVKCTFRGTQLDERNWLVDFGSLKSFKGWLEDMFDHKTLIAEDDPELKTFEELEKKGLIQLRVFPSVGMESTAYWIFQYLEMWLRSNGYSHAVVQEVEVREHEGNWARYTRKE